MTEDNFSAIFAEIIVSAKEVLANSSHLYDGDSIHLRTLQRAIDALEAYKKEFTKNETH